MGDYLPPAATTDHAVVEVDVDVSGAESKLAEVDADIASLDGAELLDVDLDVDLDALDRSDLDIVDTA